MTFHNSHRCTLVGYAREYDPHALLVFQARILPQWAHAVYACDLSFSVDQIIRIAACLWRPQATEYSVNTQEIRQLPYPTVSYNHAMTNS